MQRRRFGRTGLEVPALTFGGGWVGGLLIRGTEDERETVLNRALEAGIDWIDTGFQRPVEHRFALGLCAADQEAADPAAAEGQCGHFQACPAEASPLHADLPVPTCVSTRRVPRHDTSSWRVVFDAGDPLSELACQDFWKALERHGEPSQETLR